MTLGAARYYRPLAVVVLLLAAFNLGYRLDQEVVTEWDEALYALTAWEIVEQGHWIGTTSFGELDYYNSKPPLNVWLIAAAFTAFGPNLIALRLASALSAWATIALLMWWTRRAFGPLPSLIAGAVLSTTFGFLYVHSGRSGNPDALLTLLLLLTAVVLWAAPRHPWMRAWLGPIAAAAFLLKGAALLLPLLVIGIVECLGRAVRRTTVDGYLAPAVTAAATFLLLTGGWMVARWQVDGVLFFQRMWENDLVAITLRALDGHAGGPLFYLHTLQKNQFDWLVAALAAVLLVPMRRGWPELVLWLRSHDAGLILGAWGAVALLVPTLMQTKLPWYLNPFYPVFAVAVGLVVTRAVGPGPGLPRARRIAIAAIAAAAFVVAEGRIVWYSLHNRDLDRHTQGVVLDNTVPMRGRQVFAADWSRADRFAVAIRGGQVAVAPSADDFLRVSGPDDYLVAPAGLAHPGLVTLSTNRAFSLYRPLVARTD